MDKTNHVSLKRFKKSDNMKTHDRTVFYANVFVHTEKLYFYSYIFFIRRKIRDLNISPDT